MYADGLTGIGFFSEVADDHVELIEVVAAQRCFAVAGSHDVVAQTTQHLRQRGSQPIVIIDDKDPAFLHRSPFVPILGREGRANAAFPHHCTIFRWVAFQIIESLHPGV